MEPENDPQLHKLLREWDAPNAPPSLDERVLGRRTSWWRFLLTGQIRVPVPLTIAVMAALIVMGVFLARDRGRIVVVAPSTSASARFNLKDFQPVQDVQVRVIRSGYASQ